MYSNISNNFDMNGKSLYNALQLSAEKRYDNGLGFLVSYTLGHSLSNTSSGFSSFANAALNKGDQAPEYTVDGSDQKHIVTISGTYELPFGRGRPFLNRGGIVNQLVGGWQISPILTYSTGLRSALAQMVIRSEQAAAIAPISCLACSRSSM